MISARTVGGTLLAILAAIGLFLLAVIARCTYASISYDNEGREKTKAFCARFPPDASMDEVRAAASNEGDKEARVLERDRVVIGYLTGPMHMHRCTIAGKDGRVASATYELLD
jgi:hypothetical protein